MANGLIKRVSSWFKKNQQNTTEQTAQDSQSVIDNFFEEENQLSTALSTEKESFEKESTEQNQTKQAPKKRNKPKSPKFKSDVLVQVERNDHNISRKDQRLY